MPFNAKLIAATLLALSTASAAVARPGGWGSGWDNSGFGNSGWGNSGWGAREWADSRWDDSGPGRGRDDREGKVNVESFSAGPDAAAALGHGRIGVEIADDPNSQQFSRQVVPGASYEAAVIDQMVHAGYDTSGKPGTEDQVVELNLVRSVLTAPEAKHNPVSGEMSMGVSNRGTMMGLGINLDFSKPKGALLSTRMEARIRDKADGKVLWEGHADMATRDGDDDWGEQSIAVKLAQELFKRFPGTTEKP